MLDIAKITTKEWIALTVGFLMGVIFISAFLIAISTLIGIIPSNTADTLLTALLVMVTTIYTFATYGKWWDK